MRLPHCDAGPSTSQQSFDRVKILQNQSILGYNQQNLSRQKRKMQCCTYLQCHLPSAVVNPKLKTSSDRPSIVVAKQSKLRGLSLKVRSTPEDQSIGGEYVKKNVSESQPVSSDSKQTQTKETRLQRVKGVLKGTYTLYKQSLEIVRQNAWLLVGLQALLTGLQWTFHRIGSLLVNLAFLAVNKNYTADSLGVPNLLFITPNPEIQTFTSGYNYFAYAQGLACFIAGQVCTAIAAFIVIRSVLKLKGKSDQPSVAITDPSPPKDRLARATAVAQFRRQIRAAVREPWRLGVVQIAYMINYYVCVGLSILWIPMYWLVPRIADIRLSTTVACIKGTGVKDSFAESQQIVKGQRWPLGIAAMLVPVICWQLEMLKVLIVQIMPARLATDLPELTLLLISACSTVKFILIRAGEMLAVVVYQNHMKAGEQATKQA